LLGYSQGTTVIFSSLATNNDYLKDKVKVFAALAPVITMKYTTEELLKTLADNQYIANALAD